MVNVNASQPIFWVAYSPNVQTYPQQTTLSTHINYRLLYHDIELTQLQAFVGPRLGRFPCRWGVLGISTSVFFGWPTETTDLGPVWSIWSAYQWSHTVCDSLWVRFILWWHSASRWRGIGHCAMARRVEMHADWDEFSGKALEQGEPDAADFS